MRWAKYFVLATTLLIPLRTQADTQPVVPFAAVQPMVNNIKGYIRYQVGTPTLSDNYQNLVTNGTIPKGVKVHPKGVKVYPVRIHYVSGVSLVHGLVNDSIRRRQYRYGVDKGSNMGFFYDFFYIDVLCYQDAFGTWRVADFKTKGKQSREDAVKSDEDKAVVNLYVEQLKRAWESGRPIIEGPSGP